MKYRTLLLLIFGAMPLGLFLKGCGVDSTGTTSDPSEELSTAVRAAAVTLLEKITIETSAQVTVAGPVEAETVLAENLPDNDTATAVTLILPATSGTYYVFFVDDNPDKKMSHPVRYAWLNTDDGSSETIGASHTMIIQRSGETPTPFSLMATGLVGGVAFQEATGDGAGDEANVSDKPEDDGNTVSSLSGFARLVSDHCSKIALVIDGGEERGYFFEQEMADNMASDADTIAAYLEANGFSVTRRSQYWGNTKAGLASKEHRSFEARLKNLVSSLGDEGCPESGCCHEFFIYIAAHGGADGFLLYPKNGGSAAQKVFYQDLMSWLGDLPSCAKVTMLIDSCKSGGAITQNQTPTDTLSSFCSTHCGLTLMTATDDSHNADDGNGEDSATEDFGQGSGSDLDENGKTGDLRDRFTKMDEEGGGLNPQLYMCEGQTDMCSLD